MKDDELTELATPWDVHRRDMLKLLAGGIAALGAGCVAKPGDEIVPYVEMPEQRPGTPVRYASALALDGFAQGVLVTTREGRPIKLDGNPAHPANLGGSLPWLQAAILDLHDPARQALALRNNVPTSIASVLRELAEAPGPLWLVMPPQSSPLLGELLARLAARREVHVVFDCPLDHRNAYEGHRLVFGAQVEQQLDLARADVIASWDADWASRGPMAAAWARSAATRRATSRWWMCEPMPTPTGTLSDHRVAIAAGRLTAVAVTALARAGAPELPAELVARARSLLGDTAPLIDQMAYDLIAARVGSAIVVGDRQPPVVHALARLLGARCGQQQQVTDPVLLDPLGTTTLAELSAALDAGRVGALLVIDANPMLAQELAIARAPLSVWAGTHPDETAAACTARLPLAHPLEAWADVRAYDGTLAIAQPVTGSRVATISPLELVAALAGETTPIRALLAARQTGLRETLATGVVAGSAAPRRVLEPRWSDALLATIDHELAPRTPLEIALAPSQVHDGRFAHNAWLQELPHPITKQTWGNAALLAPATAAHLGVGDGDDLRVTTAAGSLTLPALIVPGHAEDAITIELGYGRRTRELAIANRLGANGHVLRVDRACVLAGSAQATGSHARIARTQTAFDRGGRTVAVPGEDVAAHRGPQPSLLGEVLHTGVQWAMSIDTALCTGCSACVVACQAENNIPVVGPAEISRGRGMHWLRIDSYVDGGEYIHEPMACQQCEHAPCEYVCPVGATTHSPDGLNEQTYNRCVGTRFCSNNCPYKVRRFNYFAHDSHAQHYNPDVTVRARGVMEKCTYCVQRIRRAELTARVEDRAIRPGEVTTACQDACPTGAIQFGALGLPGPLAQMRQDPRRYEALHELGTRPRTQYLARNRKGGA